MAPGDKGSVPPSASLCFWHEADATAQYLLVVSTGRSQGHIIRISSGCCWLLGDPGPLWPQELLVRFMSLQRRINCPSAQELEGQHWRSLGHQKLQSQCKHHFSDSLARTMHSMSHYPLLLNSATSSLPCPKDQWWPPHQTRCVLCSPSKEHPKLSHL